MKVKKIFITVMIILFLFMIIGSVSSSNETDELLEDDSDLELPDSVDVNSSAKAVISYKSNTTVYKENLTLKLNESDIDDFEVSDDSITFDYKLNTSSSLSLFYGNFSKSILINRVYNVNFTSVNLETDYSCGSFKFKCLDADSGDVLSNLSVQVTGNYGGKNLVWTTPTSGGVSINSYINLVSDSEGIIEVVNSNFYPGTVSSAYIFAPAGNYTFTLKSSGRSQSFATTINKVTMNITVEPYTDYVDSTNPVKIYLVNSKTGEVIKGTTVHVNMPNTDKVDYYFSSDGEGICRFYVDKLYGGTYPMTVSNNDTANFNNVSVSSSITLLAKPTVITATFTSPYYFNTGKLVTIKLTDKSTGKVLSDVIVSVKIDSTLKYYRTNSKGIVDITFAPMNIGSHKVSIGVYDTRRYNASAVTKTITVKKASAKLKVKKVKTYYKQKTSLEIKVTNKKNGKPIYMAKQYIKIYYTKNRYYKYYGQTGLDGRMRVIFDNLKPGTHRVEVMQNDKKNYKENTVVTKIIVKKAPVKFSAGKVVSKKGASSYFKVKVKNKKTKKMLSSGVKVKLKVYTAKKFKTYTVKTDSSGVAKLNVKKLSKGKHKVVVSSGDKYVKGKSVKSSIKIT